MATRKKTYKAIVIEDFKIHEDKKIVKYKVGDTYTSDSKKRIDNLKLIKKLK